MRMHSFWVEVVELLVKGLNVNGVCGRSDFGRLGGGLVEWKLEAGFGEKPLRRYYHCRFQLPLPTGKMVESAAPACRR